MRKLGLVQKSIDPVQFSSFINILMSVQRFERRRVQGRECEDMEIEESIETISPTSTNESCSSLPLLSVDDERKTTECNSR